MGHSFSLKTKVVNSKEYLFDELRKKWILSTPEEEVRQQFWKYLHFEKKYPVSLMAIEKTIAFNGLNKPRDIHKTNKPINGKDGNLRAGYRDVFLTLRYQNGKFKNINTIGNRNIRTNMNIRLYKLERILMQQVDLKSALNSKDFL